MSESSAIQPPGPAAPCSAPGCENPATRCAYVDRHHVACPTSWCPQHALVVAGEPYCRRHASIIRALEHVPVGERDLPEVDNRAPSLCEWMAARCDGYLGQLMQSLAARHAGSKFTTDGLHLVFSGVPRVHAWEHTWRVVDHTGPLYTVTVRVEETRDDVVIARVNGAAVFDARPPWITERAVAPEADEARRSAFDSELLGAVYAKIREAASR